MFCARRFEPRTEQVKKKVYKEGVQNGWDKIIDSYVNDSLQIFRTAAPMLQMLGYQFDIGNNFLKQYDDLKSNYEVQQIAI